MILKIDATRFIFTCPVFHTFRSLSCVHWHSTERAAHWPKAVYLDFHKFSPLLQQIIQKSKLKRCLKLASYLLFYLKFKNPRSQHSLTSQAKLRFQFKLKLLGCSVVNISQKHDYFHVKALTSLDYNYNFCKIIISVYSLIVSKPLYSIPSSSRVMIKVLRKFFSNNRYCSFMLDSQVLLWEVCSLMASSHSCTQNVRI